MLAASSAGRTTGPGRFLTGRGEIDCYPLDDTEILERTRSGSEYARVVDESRGS